MKNIKGIILAIMLTTITFSYSQSNVRFGVKAGINYANFSGSDINTDAISNYHAGILVELKLFDNLAIQPELLYSTIGASYDFVGNEIKNELGYISIPVLAKFNLSQSLFLEVGPQAGFLLSNKDEVNINDYNTFDFSVNAGLGINISKNLFANARYNAGLTEVSRSADVKNSVFQVSVGLLF